jgi:hypothetical protein
LGVKTVADVLVQLPQPPAAAAVMTEAWAAGADENAAARSRATGEVRRSERAMKVSFPRVS